MKGAPYKLIENADINRRVIPAMFNKAQELAERNASVLRESAMKKMHQLLAPEIQRLQTLARVNDHIRPQEISLAQAQHSELAAVLQESRLRLDCLRLIWKGSPEGLK
jgi:hypothetical protein